MNTIDIHEYKAIEVCIQHYLDGAISGNGDLMKPAFSEDATIYGYVGNDIFSGPIQNLYDWNDQNGPATDLISKIVSIDLIGTIASVKAESDNWTGHRFTDIFNLIKLNGEWKIVSKIFYLH